MNDREVINFLQFQMKIKMKELKRRWKGGEMPEIPKAEYENCEETLKWLRQQMDKVLEREYGWRSRGDEL
jgi:hypothetical protein